MEKKYIFQDPSPYPPVEVQKVNALYAVEMLGNIGEANSEMSAVSMYFYNDVISQEKYSELSYCFQHIGMVEMHHLKIFASLALHLGADPRLWSYSEKAPAYWTPGFNKYPRKLKDMLVNMIKGEEAAIEKYERQANWIKDSNIVANVNRIILDEKIHLDILRDFYHEYCK